MAKEKIWAVADCETDAFDGVSVRAFVWGYQTSEGARGIFWNTEEFLNWLRNFGGYVYAHNGGKFDWLQPEIVPHFNEGKIRLINGRLAEAKIGKATIRDSWLCLPAPLSKYGQKDDFDYSILLRENSPSRKTNKQKIEKYLMQDCAALFNAMERFISKHSFILTQAGAALKTWEAMGGEKRRYGINHDAIFRPYYIGGRCEVFECANGIEGDFKLYDINSSYPAAMSGEHCCGTDFVSARDYKKAHPSSFWSIRAVSRGALPFLENRKMFYPKDNQIREYKCTGHEIHAALEFGALDIIEACGVVPRRFETLKPYVERFFAERAICKAAGDTIGDVIAKTFSNSLYGKFGANPEEYRDYQIVGAGERRTGWTYSQTLDESDVLERPTACPQYFDVALAASITGQARATLMRGIMSSKRVMYCDTDSVLCEEFGGKVGDKLGEWKHEADVKKVWIAGKKCYALELENGEYKTAHKGVSKLDITVNDIKRAAAGEIVEIQKSAPNCKLDGRQVFFSRKIKKT